MVKNLDEETNETEQLENDVAEEIKTKSLEVDMQGKVNDDFSEDDETKFVMPGEFIGTIEELKPGVGTFSYVSDIHATTTGILRVDKKSRIISVTPKTNYPPTIAVNNIVIGSVVGVKESVVLIEIVAIKDEGERGFQKTGNAAIHVSNVKDSYCKKLDEEFAVGDIIKAKVLNIDNMRLSTAEKELGVMKAQCYNCHIALVLDDNKLKCPQCGRVEKRKISSDYGTGIV